MVEYRDYYRHARGRQERHSRRHPEGLSQAGAQVPPGRQQGPGGRGPVQGDRRGLRGPEGPGEARRSTTSSGRPGRTPQRTGAPPPGWEGVQFDFGGPGGGGGFDFGGAGPSGFSSFFEMLFGGGGPVAGAGGFRGGWRDAPGRRRRGAAAIRSRRSRSRSRRLAQRRRASDHAHRSRERRSETLEVKIPKGLRPGQRIRLAGKGGARQRWAARRAISSCRSSSSRTPTSASKGDDLHRTGRGLALGGGARRRSRGPHARRHGADQLPAGLLVGSPDPAARQGPAPRRRRARGPVRRSEDRGAARAQRRRERRAVRRAPAQETQ